MSKITLENYLREQLSIQTTKSYLFSIEHFLKTNPKAKRYKFQDMVKYMDGISKEHSNEQYRVSILSALKKYYDYLVFTGYRNDHPCKKINIKISRNSAVQFQDLFNSEELQLLMTRENRYKHLDIRNNVILSLLIYQGLTSDEVIRLEVQDINLEAGTIYIKSSPNLKRRTLELFNKQMILFSNYINEDRPKMLMCKSEKLILNKLGKPISVDGIHAMIQPLKPLFQDKNLNPRTIRMSVISNWLNEKKYRLEKVQELAGHRWPSTTEKYIKVDSNNERELINRYFPI